MFQVIDGGVTSAKGFKAANTAAGIKYTGRDDMAMIVSDSPCRSAGTYTKNVVKAAPVQFDRMRTDNTADIHAIVVNAGIANACTGMEGLKCCRLPCTTPQCSFTVSILWSAVCQSA